MAGEPENRPLEVTEFKPLKDTGDRRRFRIAPVYLGLGAVLTVAAVVFIYLLVARAVVFTLDPPDAEIEIGGLSFHIGNNYLLLPGRHAVSAQAEGYHDLQTEIDVGGDKTQEIEIALDPLPGQLQVSAALDGIEVFVDGEPAGTAPGLVENISRGSHIIEFRKHRYFPQRRDIEIEGLGRTQVVNLEMEPAWGWMQIRSLPEGAQAAIDGQPAGPTPLRAEVLETGSVLSLSMPGYKTWERELSVQAGTEQDYPAIELVVADGTVDVSTRPAGAHVSVNGEFRGTAPVSVQISPFGEHRIELFLEGYRKTVRTVTTEPEAYSELSVDLVPVIGHIRLSVSPEEAEVVVNGRSLGTGSRTLSLTARDHRLLVRLPGYESRSQTITPREGHDQSLDVSLLTLEQAYWAARPPQVTSPVGSTLKLFRPEETFQLGAPRREPGRRANEAERNVRLERPFYIGLREVTNGQFRRFRAGHTSSAVRGQTLDMDDQPTVNVSWNEAALFCNWLSRQEGLPPFYVEQAGQVTSWDPDSHGYRLPTEAEWAYAARLAPEGQTLMFPWGTQVYPPPRVVANYADRQAADLVTFVLTAYDDGFAVTAPVGSFEANARGMYDMSGNVSEWVNDFFEIRPVRGEPLVDPMGPETGDRHVVRGASWAKASRSELRLAYRNAGRDGNLDTGFRIARYVDKAGAKP